MNPVETTTGLPERSGGPLHEDEEGKVTTNQIITPVTEGPDDDLADMWADDSPQKIYDGDEVTRTSSGNRKIYQDVHNEAKELQKLQSDLEKRSKTAQAILQDMHNLLYQQVPKIKPDNDVPDSNHVNLQLAKAIENSSAYRSLRAFTMDDDVGAAMAILAMKEHILQIIDEELKKAQAQAREDEQEAQSQQEMQNLAQEAGDKPAFDKAKGEKRQAQGQMKQSGPAAKRASQKKGAHVRTTIRSGLKGALKDAKDAADALAAVGWGTDPGTANQRKNPRERLEEAKRLRNAKRLVKAAALIGKMKGIAFERQRNKINKGHVGVADITRGNDIARLHHAEIAKLAHPLLRKVFFKDFTERNLLQYKPKSIQKPIMGPAVVCLDSSGSMWGARADWAMSLILALHWVCQKQQRPFYVIVFDTIVHKVWDLSNAGVKEIIDFASTEYGGGGTNFDVPLQEAIRVIREIPKFSKADVVFVTDGECEIYKRDEIKKEMKDANIYLYTFQVESRHHKSESLKKLSTRYYSLKDFEGKDNKDVADLFDSI